MITASESRELLNQVDMSFYIGYADSAIRNRARDGYNFVILPTGIWSENTVHANNLRASLLTYGFDVNYICEDRPCGDRYTKISW